MSEAAVSHWLEDYPHVEAKWVPWQPFGARFAAWTQQYIQVTELEIKGEVPAWVGAQQLPCFTGLKVLRLRGDSVTDELLCGVSCLPELQHLSVVSRNVDGAFLDRLPAKGELRSLELLSVRLRDPVLHRVSRFSTLEALHLRGLKIKDVSALRKLSNLRRLRNLSLSVEELPDDGLSFLSSLEQLEELELRSWTLSNRHVRDVADCRHIWNLEIMGREVDDEAIDMLAAMPALELLWLRDTRITPAGEKRLRQLRPDIYFLQVTRPR
jgi:hypothetical protein